MQLPCGGLEGDRQPVTSQGGPSMTTLEKEGYKVRNTASTMEVFTCRDLGEHQGRLPLR